MPTNAEQLETIKANVLAILVDLTENPKPTYTIDGQKVAWAEYFKTLTDQLAVIDEQLTSEDPFEIIQQAIS
ncbi:MAG: hypothetical protein H8E37_14330 [Planctomycetes bacterium]|nr:hypothetical protein [Planctomycetota bacterium]